MDRWDGYTDYYGTFDYYPEDELYHYGVKGQRWGVRRYQNADGSLTDAGRAHYGRSSSGSRRAGGYSSRGGKKVNWKKVAAVGAGVAGAAALGYGGYRLLSRYGRKALPGAISMTQQAGGGGGLRYKASNFARKFYNSAKAGAYQTRKAARNASVRASVNAANAANQVKRGVRYARSGDMARDIKGAFKTAGTNFKSTGGVKGAATRAWSNVSGAVRNATTGRRRNVGAGRQLSTNVRSMSWYDRVRYGAPRARAQNMGAATYREAELQRKARAAARARRMASNAYKKPIRV